MKLNNPATWLLGAAILGVGFMALSGKKRVAYAENDCTRIVIQSPQAFADFLNDPAMTDKIRARFADGGTPDELVDFVIAELVPGCPSPLSEETVVVFTSMPDQPTTIGEIQDTLRDRLGGASVAGGATVALVGAFTGA